VGVEVKAAATVKESDLRGLKKLAGLAARQFKTWLCTKLSNLDGYMSKACIE